MKWYSGDSQIKWVCIELLKGKEITHMDEIENVKGWRLSAIIYNLRHEYDWPISTWYDENKIAHYRLEDKTDTDELRKPRSYYPEKKGAATPSSKSDSNNPNLEDIDK